MKRNLALLSSLLLAAGACLTGLSTTYTVATDVWPPWEWQDEAGNYYGFDLDVIRCIAVLEGFEVEIRDCIWATIFVSVSNGDFDIGASTGTITEEHESLVDFSEAYWTAYQAVLVLADSGLTADTALGDGCTVGVLQATPGMWWVYDELIDYGVDVELVDYPCYAAAIEGLINGDVDTVFLDEGLFAARSLDESGTGSTDEADLIVTMEEGGCPSTGRALVEDDLIIVVDVVDIDEEYGFFVAEGDPERLLSRINSGIEKLHASGAWENLVRAYMGTDLATVEAAWKASQALLEAGDVDAFAQQLADLANP